MNRLKSIEGLGELRLSIQRKVDPQKTCVRICMTGCRAYGAEDLLKAFKTEIKKRKWEHKVEIRETGCHGFCAKAAVVGIDPQGIFYQQVTPGDVLEIVSKTVGQGKLVERLLYHDSANGKAIPLAQDIPFYKGQVINALSNCGKIDPKSIEHYIERDGYAAMARVLSSMTPDQVIDEVKRSGLRGRGGAGFPTGMKWSFMKASPGKVKYLICNADEGDPGAFMDRAVLEGDPHSVIEGMLVGAYAMGATAGYIYVRAEYPIAVEHLKIAVTEAEKIGLLGDNILGKDFSFKIIIKEGAGAFVCGEETALMASIEGRKGMPRPRPPFPAQAGLWGKPTNINNVETYANIRSIILKGADWFASMGTEGSKGTKIFSLAGKVNNTGLVEVPIGIKVGEVIFDIGGGIPRGKKFKAVQMGGPSGGCVPVKYLDLPIDYDSLEKIGAIMGSGGMVVMDEATCMVDIAKFFLNFTQSESCGKCVPCRVGTKRMLEILNRISRGEGVEEDIDLLIEMGQAIKDSALCGLGQTVPNPVLSTIRYFRDEYEAHIREKRCPAAVCEALVYAPCEHTCPVNVDAVGYVALTADGKFGEALDLIRQRNPLAAVCGRVCVHPCETRCKRGDVDQPIAIEYLKRVAADYGLKHRWKTKVEVEPAKNEKVAIVGSGPAGLNCAYHLARKGYRVTVFEALPVAGGMMAVGIPSYRLPRNILKADIDFIRSLGVEIKTNTPVGGKLTLKKLLKQGYKAVFLAVGAHQGMKLGIEGENLQGVMDAVSFLLTVNLGKKASVGKKVAVIGGGNAAVDAARTALRLGAREVTMVYRRTREEMPASPEEIAEMEEEGIEIKFLVAPQRIIGKGKKVSGLECLRMELGDYDASGRRRPVAIKGSEFTLEVDMVVAAISQFPEVSFLAKSPGIDVTKGETIVVDPLTLATSRPGIFAGGDAVTGPSTVVQALHCGEEAAISIDKFLRGEDMHQNRLRVPPRRVDLPKAEEETKDKMRVKVPVMPSGKRIHSFDEVVKGYTLAQAKEEARRCLRCDLEE